MWASLFHLFIGNAIIGLAEGLLLARLFRCSAKRSILILIAANYASALAGACLFSAAPVPPLDLTIENVGFWLIISVLVAFSLTLLIELPFFWLILSQQKQPLRRAIKATVLIHCISYPLLIGAFLSVSPISMVTGLTVVAPDDLLPEGDLALYFISTDGEQVLQRPFQIGAKVDAIGQVFASAPNDRLFARPNSESGFDLFALREVGPDGAMEEILAKSSFASKAPLEAPIAEDPTIKADYWLTRPGQVPSLFPDSDWEFHTGYYPSAGIRGDNEESQRNFLYALETPFVGWRVGNATHISGDFVVFQLGPDQICILHPESKKIALIARGKAPIVAKPLAPPDEP